MVEKTLITNVFTQVGMLQRQTLIGSYKMSLRTIYKESKHLSLFKWMVLADPERVAGAVKASADYIYITSCLISRVQGSFCRKLRI